MESIDRRDRAGKVNGPAELHELVERFVRDLPLYRCAGFNEAQGRIDFINPLLALHGWEIQNRQGLPKAYREVVYEDRVTNHQIRRLLYELYGFPEEKGVIVSR